MQCGDKAQAVLAVPDSAACFEAPSKFSIDGLTEKVTWVPTMTPLQLHFITCAREEELKANVKKYLGQVRAQFLNY